MPPKRGAGGPCVHRLVWRLPEVRDVRHGGSGADNVGRTDSRESLWAKPGTSWRARGSSMVSRHRDPVLRLEARGSRARGRWRGPSHVCTLMVYEILLADSSIVVAANRLEHDPARRMPPRDTAAAAGPSRHRCTRRRDMARRACIRPLGRPPESPFPQAGGPFTVLVRDSLCRFALPEKVYAARDVLVTEGSLRPYNSF
jgi:hypothetical protein